MRGCFNILVGMFLYLWGIAIFVYVFFQLLGFSKDAALIGTLIVPFLYLLVRWIRATRFDDSFREEQRRYEKARKQAAQDTTINYSELPVFPMCRTPYSSDAEYEINKIQLNGDGDLYSFTENALQHMRSIMPELLYMRGDKHVAADDHTKVILAIEEVKKAGNELAIAALIVTKRGALLNVSVRWSCWPNTIHMDVPRRRKVSSNIRYDKPRDTACQKYFAPIGWTRGAEKSESTHDNPSYDVIPDFYKETESTAQDIAISINNMIQNMVRRY